MWRWRERQYSDFLSQGRVAQILSVGNPSVYWQYRGLHIPANKIGHIWIRPHCCRPWGDLAILKSSSYVEIKGKANIQTSLVKDVLRKSYKWEILACIGHTGCTYSSKQDRAYMKLPFTIADFKIIVTLLFIICPFICIKYFISQYYQHLIVTLGSIFLAF
jgi:hypothetical protein